jgi:hypothetical protein
LTGRSSNPGGSAGYRVPAFAGMTDDCLISLERKPL